MTASAAAAANFSTVCSGLNFLPSGGVIRVSVFEAVKRRLAVEFPRCASSLNEVTQPFGCFPLVALRWMTEVWGKPRTWLESSEWAASRDELRACARCASSIMITESVPTRAASMGRLLALTP